MARDKAACVARQAIVSRHGAGLGSRCAQGRWGTDELAGARWACKRARGHRRTRRRAGSNARGTVQEAATRGARGREGQGAWARGQGARQQAR